MRRHRRTFFIVTLLLACVACTNVKPTINLTSLAAFAKFILPSSMLTAIGGSYEFKWDRSDNFNYKLFNGPNCNGAISQSASINGTGINLNITPGFNSLFLENSKGSACSPLVKSPGTASVVELNLKTMTNFSFGAYMNGIYYFLGVSDAAGEELWRTDGTEAGTYMVKDIHPGPNSSNIANWNSRSLAVFQNRIIFAADDGVNGLELWSSDGTGGGTLMAADIAPGLMSSAPNEFILSPDGMKIYFKANDASYDYEIYSWDGILAPAKINVNLSGSSNASNLTMATISGTPYLYMSADTPSSGNELARINITNDTVTLYDINSGLSGSNPQKIGYDGSSYVYFSAYNGASTRFYKANSGGYSILCNSAPNIIPAPSTNFVAMAGKIYFSGDDNTGNGYELIKFDGSTCSTITIEPGSMGSGPDNLVVANDGTTDRLLFSAYTTSESMDVFTYDGSMLQLLGLAPGPASVSIVPTSQMKVGNKVLFRMYTPDLGEELYISDGTLSGTKIIAPESTGATSSSQLSIAASGSSVYFIEQKNNDAAQIYKWTSGPDTLIAGPKVTQKTNGIFVMGEPLEVNSKIYFVPDIGSVRELYVTDGSSTATKPVTNFSGSGAGNINYYMSSDKKNLGLLNDEIYFALDVPDTPYNRQQLWKYNTRSNTTALVKDLGQYFSGTPIKNFYPVGNYLYFTASTVADGNEVWRTDGTAAGTILFDLYPGAFSGLGAFQSYASFKEKFYFIGNTGMGDTLYRIDNVLSVPEIVRTVNYPAATDVISSPKNLTVSNDLLFFAATTSNDVTYPSYTSDGEELFAVNSSGMAYLVKNINPGANSSPQQITPFNGKIIFQAYTSTEGGEAWISDGTSAGTYIVRDINGNSNSSVFLGSEFAVFENKVFFQAEDASYDRELWVTDGTGPGTVLVKNINLSGSSNPSRFISVGGKLFFGAYDNAATEMWTTDGTSAGTQKVVTLYPNYTQPVDFMGMAFNYVFKSTQTIIYTSNNPLRGQELYIFVP